MDLSNSDNIVDWTHEREWRVPKEIVFEYSQCEIILPTSCKCQYKNDQKVENKNVHFPRSIPQFVFP